MSSQVMYFADRFRPRRPGSGALPLLLVPLALAGLVDLPGDFREGTISFLGMLGVLQVALAVAGLLVARVYPRVVLARFLPYGLFLSWMVFRSLVAWPFAGGPEQGALQNGMAYMLFGVEFLLGATVAAAASTTVAAYLRRGFFIMDAIALILVALSLRHGLPGDDLEIVWWVSPRSIALLAIVPISWHMACWCHGQRGEGLRALAWILAVFVSLSRTATAVAVLICLLALIVQFWLTPRTFFRRTPFVAVAGAVVVWLVLAFQSTFYQRFFEGYSRVDVAGVSVSTSGRDTMWPIVFDSALQHPIVGGGLGSAQIALGELVQPHNEYLRVWHDGGLIAIALLLFAFIKWLLLLRRQYVASVVNARNHPEIELAALFTLLGIMLAAITDNGFMYMFVVAPSGLLIGVAFGLRAYEVEPAPSTLHAPYTEAPLGA